MIDTNLNALKYNWHERSSCHFLFSMFLTMSRESIMGLLLSQWQTNNLQSPRYFKKMNPYIISILHENKRITVVNSTRNRPSHQGVKQKQVKSVWNRKQKQDWNRKFENSVSVWESKTESWKTCFSVWDSYSHPVGLGTLNVIFLQRTA